MHVTTYTLFKLSYNSHFGTSLYICELVKILFTKI